MNENEIEVSTYDILLRSLENSRELVRDFENYSKSIDNEKIQEIFKQFAEDEGHHAAQFRKLLLDYKDN